MIPARLSSIVIIKTIWTKDLRDLSHTPNRRSKCVIRSSIRYYYQIYAPPQRACLAAILDASQKWCTVLSIHGSDAAVGATDPVSDQAGLARSVAALSKKTAD